MREVGIEVPNTFNDLPGKIKEVYTRLRNDGTIIEVEEPEINIIPAVRKSKVSSVLSVMIEEKRLLMPAILSVQ